ncbi:MAG: hypothetical protein VKJ05_03800 [Synechococcaceae cyanobacterium]|nr:hypothetical protein [Synechococcaceae cyanobacterium]
MAPLIRFTLLALYLALVLPLPFLAPAPLRGPLTLALPLGLLLVLAVTSERVELDANGVRVGHPAWCAWLLRRSWELPWQKVQGLTPVATSQGGRVWYVRTAGGSAESPARSFLLPQRVARFDDFLTRFASATGLDTTAVGRISPPWTYQLLAALCAALLVAEVAGLALLLPLA